MHNGMPSAGITRRDWLRGGVLTGLAVRLLHQPLRAADAGAASAPGGGLVIGLPAPNFHHPLDAQLASMKGSQNALVAKKYMVLHDQALHHYNSLGLTPTNDLRGLGKPSDFTLKPGRVPDYFSQPWVKLPIKPIEHFPGFYDYLPDPDSKVTAFWVDFANLDLGGGVFGSGFVQEEILCCEVPELANASALSPKLQTRTPGREVLAGSPTPLALMGVHRVIEFYSSRPGHPYGTDEFRALDINRPQDYIRRLDSPAQFHVLAMAAPHLQDRSPQSQFGLTTLQDLFNTFVAGFTLASTIAKSDGRHATLNTGKIGSGDFNNNPNVVYVLQGLAAELVGVNLRFWGYADWEVELAGRYYAAIRRRIVPGSTRVDDLLNLAQQVLSAPLLADVTVHGDQLDGNLYGEPKASYRLQNSTDLEHWSDGGQVTLDRVPTPVSVPSPAGGGPVFLRAGTP